ncbi:MAG: FtsX-like permease family protein [Erysipelotrichaceae bacterium]|nr:FtsX-like permease family protein [Erysipelotrichaceae bacterium]
MVSILVYPLFKKYIKLFFGISIALALSMSLLFGLTSACDSVDKSLDTFASQYRYADGIITTKVLDKNICKEIENINGVKSLNYRLTFDFQGKLSNGRYINVRAITYNYRDYGMQYTYDINESGDYPNVSVNKSFLDNNDIEVGDLIEADFADKKETLCMGRSITTPDCVSLILNKYIYGNNPDLAYMYLPEDYLLDTDYNNQFNQLLIFFEDWADQESLMNRIKIILGQSNILDDYLYSNSIIRNRIDINIKPVKSLSLLLPSAFFVIVICVSFLFLTQIIKQSRKDIGILRTLGRKITDIYYVFAGLVLFTSFLSIFLGTILGIFVTYLTSTIYVETFNIPYITYKFNIVYYIISIIATIVSGQIAVLLSIGQIKEISPTESLREEVRRPSNFDIKINNKLSNYSSKIKYGINSILKNKKRFIFSTLCLTATVMMIFTSWAFYDSKNEIKSSLFDERIKFDFQFFYDEKINDNDIKLLNQNSFVDAYEILNYIDTTIEFNNRKEDITVRGIEPNSSLIGLYKLNSINADISDGLIIEKHIAQNIGANIGDKVLVNGVEFVVEGMVDEYVDRYCYVKNDNLAKIKDIDQYSVVLKTGDETKAINFANSQDNISIASSTTSNRKGIEKEFSLYNIGVYFIIGFSLIIGFVIVYNTTINSLYEQKKELSVLRTIGYQVKDISRIWLFQTGIQTIISIIVGLILGVYFSRFAMSVISTSTREYPFTSSIKQYYLTIIIVLVFIVFTHYIAMQNIRKWNLVENTKEKD